MDNKDFRLKVHQPDQRIGQSRHLNNEKPQLGFNVDYHYNGNGTLWIITRDGLCYCLDGSQGRRSVNEQEGLTIYCAHRLEHYVHLAIHRELLSIPTFSGQLYNTIMTRPVECGQRGAYYENFISDADIHNKGGSIYIQALDIVACTVDPIFNGIKHPFSPTVELTSELIGKHHTNGAATVKVRIIDNEGVTPTKYYRLGDIAISVLPVANGELKSGLYVIYRGATEADEIRNWYSLADMENDKTPIKFFNSKPEALAYDAIGAMKLRTEELKAQQQLQKPIDDEANGLRQQLQSLRDQQMTEYTRTIESMRTQHQGILEQERKRFTAEHEIFKSELEALRKEREHRVKDRYDDLSYERKNFNEMLKMIPAIVSIVLSVVVLVKAKK